MANHKATQKDVRQAAKRRERNKYYGKTTRNAIRDMKATTGKEMADQRVDSQRDERRSDRIFAAFWMDRREAPFDVGRNRAVGLLERWHFDPLLARG